ncbi:MAG: type II toxin-antitoxin system VapC family toxin [Ginsengibacter sp.]
MTNKIFLDSSVLIEYLKGNKTGFYKSLISDLSNDFFINDIVVSEYLYYILGFSSGVSPRTLQQKRKIKETVEEESKIINTIKDFKFVSPDETIFIMVPEYMSKYNLLPNDAIILATSKLHGTKLASHDSDFIIPCQSENIELIRDINPKS